MERKQIYKRLDNSMIKKYTTDAGKDRTEKTLREPNNEESLTNKLQNSTGFASSRTPYSSSGNKVYFIEGAEYCENGSRKISKARQELSSGSCLRINANNNRKDADFPLQNMLCTGQKVECQREKTLNGKHAISGASKQSLRRQQEAHSIAINKLYSSLKKLKSRHDAIMQEDISMKCSSFPFNNNKSFGNNWLTNPAGEEDIFILLGGKSKPVRFEVNPENINLLESQFGINLKSKTGNSILDGDDLELLRRFREKYRSGQRNESPFLPWARHAVCRGRKTKDISPQTQSADFPSATYNIAEEEYGRKLSIHVYLPNILRGDLDTSTDTANI